MYSSFQLIMCGVISSVFTAALVETVHFIKDSKKEKAGK